MKHCIVCLKSIWPWQELIKTKDDWDSTRYLHQGICNRFWGLEREFYRIIYKNANSRISTVPNSFPTVYLGKMPKISTSPVPIDPNIREL